MFALRPMTAADAEAVAGWRYPGEYAFYDATADPADLALLLDPAGWGTRYFAADLDGKLAGFFEFKPAAGEVHELGLGLRPDLTGRGLGAAFLAAGLEFAAARFGATPGSPSPSPRSTGGRSASTSAPASARSVATRTRPAAASTSSCG